jgi:protein tyrosine/serine phosphatase
MTTTVGEHFARAVAAKDSGWIRSLLAEDLDFEALTPRRHWTASTPREVADDIILKHWFGPEDDIHEIRLVSVGQVADLQRVSYRFAIARGGREHVLEQQAYYSSDGEHITWMRIVCSGYRPNESRLNSPSPP